MSKSNVVGEVTVTVKAGLSVDIKTFRTCMNLIAIHAENNGLKGMVVRFSDDMLDGFAITPLETDDEVHAAEYAKFHCECEKGEKSDE